MSTESSMKAENERLAFRVCDLFFREMKSVAEIAPIVNHEFQTNKSREQIYPILARAERMGLVRLVPPLEQSLAEKVATKYKLSPERIFVVNVEGKWSGDHVAAAAADLVFRRCLKDLAAEGKKAIGLGLGPGRATLDFCRHLGTMLRDEQSAQPKLKLIAISAGCAPQWPEYASVSFFNLFPRKSRVEEDDDKMTLDEEEEGSIGLFAAPMVPANEYEQIKRQPLVRDAFLARDAVDIVVTGMGDITDEHDLLRRLLKGCGHDIQKLIRAGWKGNVQYRPYSESQAIIEKGRDMRAVTLFEIDDFVKLAAKRDKRVVLIARECGRCGMSRAKALQPLLREPQLKVWSELVMDTKTAQELL